MTSVNKSKPTHDNNNKKRKHKFLPNYKPVKKGLYPVRPGVQGFFITCDGGRERQASHEAINVIDSFYEELIHGKVSSVNVGPLLGEKINKKTKFTYSDSENDDEDGENKSGNDQGKDKPVTDADDTENKKSSINGNSASNEKLEIRGDDKVDSSLEICQDVKGDDKFGNDQGKDKSVTDADNTECKKSSINGNSGSQEELETVGDEKVDSSLETCQDIEGEEPVAKKQCTKENALEGGNVVSNKVEEKSIDKLIEEELQELGDRSKRRFSNLDSGCNGLVFVQMRKIDADPSPTDIVQHMMMSLASTRKHMSRFLLRVLPIEVTCYASEDEITKAIKPLVSQHFPLENHGGHKFAVLYEARANTGIDRAKIINAVAKCVPAPHKVDLNNPEKNIVVQIVKTVCMIGVIEKYKELAKFNVRQLTAPKP